MSGDEPRQTQRLQFGANASNVNSHTVGFWIKRYTPHIREKLALADPLTGLLSQSPNHSKFSRV